MWRWIRVSQRGIPPLALLFLAAAAAAQTLEPAARDSFATAPPASFKPAVLGVTINRETQADAIVVLRDDRGNVLVGASDLARWRLRVPASGGIAHEGERYFALAAMPGLVATLREREQALTIEAPPALFVSTTIDAAAAVAPVATRSANGAFVNYAFLATRADAATSVGAAFEAGVFGRWGVLTQTGTFSNADALRWTRLESTWSYAMPERLATVRIGDTISRPGSWGNALRFGGVQFATDFATRPDLILSPGQAVAGQVSVPSTVDVFVNNALVTQQAVRPGPFSISNIAPVSGAGNVTLVIRDELGREQVISRPFYSSPTLLRPGLVDFSLEAGRVRRDFGVSSDDYGAGFGAATGRLGLSERATGELRAEAQTHLANAGAGADVLLGDAGVLSASAVAGHNRLGSGGRLSMGLERQSPGLSFGVHGTWASSRFRQLGDFESSLTVDSELLASAAYGFGRLGTLSLAYVQRHYREQAQATIASLGYSLTLERWGYLGTSLSRVAGGSSVASVRWTIPFGASTSATLGVDRVRGAAGVQDEHSVSVQQNLPSGEGFGWRLRASDIGPRQAEVGYQNRYGTYSAEVAQVQGRSGERFAMSGGIGMIGDALFMSRAIDDSFGLVRLRGYPDVRVYAENQEIGRTDAAGTLILPRLLAYQRNTVRIEQADLPLDAEFDALTQEAVPFARSGVVVEFGVRSARGAMLKIVQENGAPVPAGARVSIEDGTRSFLVGLAGEAYLAGLGSTNRALVSWQAHQCTFEFAYAASADPQPHLGSFVCRRTE